MLLIASEYHCSVLVAEGQKKLWSVEKLIDRDEGSL